MINAEDWSEDLAKAMAASEKLELTDRHWDVINHLRDEFFNNAGNQPNTRKLVKHFEKLWGEKLMQKYSKDSFCAIQVNKVEEYLGFLKVEKRRLLRFK